MGIIWDSVTGGFVALNEPYRFSLDEPPNFTERIAWWRQLMPIFEGVPAKLCCTPEILVSTFIAWDCELSGVEAPALMVEADGDGSFHVDDEDMAWLTLCSCDRFEFDGADGFELAPAGAVLDYRLFRMPLGEAHVSPPEVTL